MARTRTLFSSALLGLLLAAAAPAAVHAEESTSTTPTHSATAAACATGIHVIVARGSSEKPGVGRMGVVAGNVTERVPGSTVEAVTYPATFDDYIDSEGEGVVAMTDMVVEYVKSCPDARIALLGYSQGAQAAMDVVCGTSEKDFEVTSDLSSSFEKNIIAVVTFGDPSHIPDMEWDFGTSNNSGIFPRLNTSACEPYTDVIRSWCDEGDIYCDAGSNRAVHGTYFANYTDDAVDFIVGNFNRSREGGGSSGGNSTATTGSGTSVPSSTGTATTTTGAARPTDNAAGSRQPSGVVLAGLTAMVMACVALF